MKFPSWEEFKEKASNFESFLDDKRKEFRDNVQGFKDKHQTADEIITTAVRLLPSPFNAIAEAFYKGSGGSDEQKLINVKEYFEKIQKSGEEHYRELLENIKKNNEVLKNNLYQSYGLNWLPYDYFDKNKIILEEELKVWKDGFEFKLPAIKNNLELKRDKVIDAIKERLENQNRLLILGESGSSKTTILQEILCDYFDKEYLILYNWGTDEIKQGDQLVNFLGDLLNEGKRILVVVDDAHTTDVSGIFYVMDQISSHVLSKNLLFLLAGGIPDFELFVKDRLDQVRQGKESIRKFNKEEDFKFALKEFSEDDIKSFIRKYLPTGSRLVFESLDLKSEVKVTVDDSSESIDRISALLMKQTNRLPVMIKFFLFGQGLRADVQRRYESHLKNYPERMHTMVICSLLTLSNLRLNDDRLEAMGIIEYVYELEHNIMNHLEADREWKTLHPRWDMELLSLLYNEKQETLLRRSIRHLERAVQTIFNTNDERIIYSAIRGLYDLTFIRLAGFENIPITIVERVVPNRMPDYLDKGLKSNIYASVIAYAYGKLEKYNEAIENCNKAINIDPNNAVAWGNKGISYYLLGDYKASIESFDKALEIKPDLTGVWTGKGRAYSQLRDYQGAIDSFDKALEIDPNNAEVWNNKGVVYHELSQYMEAIDSFDKALEIDPNNAEVWNNKGTSLRQLGDSKGAIESYYNALVIRPDYVEAWTNAGNLLFKDGDYSHALNCYDNALEIKQDDAEVWNNKGSAHLKIGDYRGAVDSYDKAILIKEDYMEAWYNKGLAYGYSGDYKGALESFDNALEIKQDDAEVWNNKGITHFVLGDYRGAVDSYDKALQNRPNFDLAWKNRGDALAQLGDYRGAVDSYDKALQLNPDYADALRNKGLAQDSLGNQEEATKYYRKTFQVLDKKGWSLLNLGKYEEAIEYFNRALEIDPNNAKVLNSKGIVLSGLNKPEEAVRYYDKALEIDPDYLSPLVNKGNALKALKRYEEAVRYYDKALEIDPNDVGVWNNKGTAFYEQGKYEEAIKYYDKALEIDPNNVNVLNSKGFAISSLQEHKADE